MRYNYGEYSVLPLGAFEKECGKMKCHGGGGFLGLGPAPSAPPPPDYRAAAQETARGNLDAARASLAGSLINQETPYGSLQYVETGEDRFGNPRYTARTSLSDSGRAVLAQQNKLSEGLASGQDRALGYINEQLANRFDTSDLPSVGIEPGQTYTQAAMQTLQPQIEASREALEQNLANSGIAPGSEAYERAHLLQNQKENQLLNQAVTSGFQTGLAANQNAFNQRAYARNEPVNLLASLRSGSQVTNPTFVNTPTQATTAGPDLLGAAQAGYNAQLGDFNAKQAAQANANAGFGQLAQIGLMAFCEREAKMHIHRIGHTECGLGIYSWVYRPEHQGVYGMHEYMGFMVDEVQEHYPHAVVLINGQRHIDYSKLQGVVCHTTTQ